MKRKSVNRKLGGFTWQAWQPSCGSSSTESSWVSNATLSVLGHIFYLLWKVVCLFCCFVCHTEISQTKWVPMHTLGIIENPWMVEVHWGSYIMLRPMVWELLNIELIYQRKLNKIKTKKMKGDLGKLLVWLESPQWVGFYGGDFVISRHKVWLIMNFE
jgi:hypothetical protein